MKISVFENFLKCSLFDRISCYGVLGSLKHARPPCKGPISVFFRFLISPSHHTVSQTGWRFLRLQEIIKNSSFCMIFWHLNPTIWEIRDSLGSTVLPQIAAFDKKFPTLQGLLKQLNPEMWGILVWLEDWKFLSLREIKENSSLCRSSLEEIPHFTGFVTSI